MKKRMMLCWIVIAACPAAYPSSEAQRPLPLSTFLTTHPLGAPDTNSTREIALSAWAAVVDEQVGSNPATLPQSNPGTIVKLARAKFDHLPDFSVRYLTTPIKLFGGQGTLFAIDVKGSKSLNGPILRLEEKDFGIQWGKQVTEKFSFGFATSILTTNNTLTIPGQGLLVSQRSRPKGVGGRIGLLYQLSKKTKVGLVIDRYQERVKQKFALIPVQLRGDFKGQVNRIGLSHQLDQKNLLAVDFVKTKFTGPSFRYRQSTVSFGAERTIGSITLRAGLYRGQFSGGIGTKIGKVKIDWAMTNRYGDQLPGSGGRTSHYLQIRLL